MGNYARKQSVFEFYVLATFLHLGHLGVVHEIFRVLVSLMTVDTPKRQRGQRSKLRVFRCERRPTTAKYRTPRLFAPGAGSKLCAPPEISLVTLYAKFHARPRPCYRGTASQLQRMPTTYVAQWMMPNEFIEHYAKSTHPRLFVAS